MIDGLKPYPAMKDSGIELLGDLPAHWDVRRLGQFGTFSKGSGGNKEDEISEGISCIRYGDLYTTHQYFISKSRSFVSSESAKKYTPIRFGDVLFAASGETVGEIGKSAVNLLQSEVYCGGDVILFRPKRAVEPRYIGYATDCLPAAVQKATLGRGITVIHIYADQLKRLSVALPPLPEQIAIVRFLDHVDRRIRRYIGAKKKLIALLEEQKQAIIHQAVTGRIDVRTGQPYSAYNPSGVEWLGDVPAHWEVRKLGQCGVITKGNGGSKEDELSEGIPCVRYGDLYTTHKHVISKSRSCISIAKSNEYTRMEYGDVLFAASGETIEDIGKSAVNLMQEEARCGGDIVLFRSKREFDARHLGYLMDCPAAINQKATMGRGITVMHIYGAQLKNLTLPVAPLREQTAIAQFLDDATSKIDNGIAGAQGETDLIREYRTRLIADVVTGKLDVREAAAGLPEEPDEADAAGGHRMGAERGDDGRTDGGWRTEARATRMEMTS